MNVGAFHLAYANALTQAFKHEEARRKFMQVFGRYLMWGLTDDGMGVYLVDEHAIGPYKRSDYTETYVAHGWDEKGPVSDAVRDSAERAVIDKAIAAAKERESKETSA